MYDWYRWASAIGTLGAVSGLTGYEMTLSFTLEDIDLSHAPCIAVNSRAARGIFETLWRIARLPVCRVRRLRRHVATH